MKTGAQYWDTLEDYHYIRLQPEDDHDVLFVGGEDHQTGMKPSEYYDAWARLEEWTRARWTMAQDVLYKWCAASVFFFSSLPLSFVRFHRYCCFIFIVLVALTQSFANIISCYSNVLPSVCN